MLLETERLIVRGFSENDWSDLHEYLSLEQVLKYEPGGVSGEEECKNMARERAEGDCFWAVSLKETNKMIGHVYFGQQEPAEFKTWMIGYIFNPDFYGKGYATEACQRVLEYGFEELGIHRVVAMCNPENASSWRLLERLNMRREGHFKKKAFFKRTDDGQPVWHDAYQYAILNEEWSSIV
ncbi:MULTISPECIES: GNAT family N-acetyltransferase [unclassified Paenibacillus]|uniref:GNAT family N-acetyltransferase n=1 Tax=unclassified Paenibacillus TaxID=185978 RepID=UPI0030F62E50